MHQYETVTTYKRLSCACEGEPFDPIEVLAVTQQYEATLEGMKMTDGYSLESTPFMGISKVFMDDTHGHFPSQLPWPLEAVREDVDTDTLIFKRTDMEDPNAGIPANSLPPVTPTDSAELLGAK